MMILFITVSSLAMAFDSPLNDPNSLLAEILYVMNLFFTALFGLEMMLKHFAYGVFFGEEAYWRQGWNRLDGLVVVISLMNLLLADVEMSAKIQKLRGF